MSKYVRTKNGIYEKNKVVVVDMLDAKCFVQVSAVEFTKGNISTYEDIIKEANTIEELCDMFVVRKETCRDLLVAKSWAKSYNEILYGAIWNDKGLIFVARLNMNNEWELI